MIEASYDCTRSEGSFRNLYASSLFVYYMTMVGELQSTRKGPETQIKENNDGKEVQEGV